MATFLVVEVLEGLQHTPSLAEIIRVGVIMADNLRTEVNCRCRERKRLEVPVDVVPKLRGNGGTDMVVEPVHLWIEGLPGDCMLVRYERRYEY